MDEGNVKQSRTDAKARLDQRQRINKAILNETNKGLLKRDTGILEELSVDLPPWTQFIMSQYSD